MPTADFNIGKDVSLDIIDPVSGPLRFGIRTRFEATPQYDEISSKALDGNLRTASVPNGHRLVFGLDRADRRLDDYFSQKEENYFNGVVDPLVSVTVTIRELDGSVSTWRYTGVSLRLTNGGTWAGNATATMAMEGTARRKVKVP